MDDLQSRSSGLQQRWLSYFTARGVAAMQAERERIAAKISREGQHGKALAAVPVLLEAQRVEDQGQIASVRRAYSAAIGAGWSARIVRSLAVDPRKGLIEAVTIRCSRHDERLWAAWHNGRFVCAWYWSSDAPLERLGWRSTVRARGVVDALEGRRLIVDSSSDMVLECVADSAVGSG